MGNTIARHERISGGTGARYHTKDEKAECIRKSPCNHISSILSPQSDHKKRIVESEVITYYTVTIPLSMKVRVRSLLLTALLTLSVVSLPVPIVEAQSNATIDTIDTPEDVSVQQLAWDGEDIWYIASGQDITLREVSPANGSEISRVDLNENQVSGLSGLSAANDSVWALNKRQLDETGEIYRINSTSGLTEKTLPAPMTRPNGLAYDGEYLWTYNAENYTLQALDPQTGDAVQTIQVPSTALAAGTDLAWGSGFLWATSGREVIQIDVSGGVANIVNEHDVPVNSARGITWDGENSWVGTSSTINRIDLGPIGEPNSPPNASFEYSPASLSAQQEVELNASSSNDSNGYIQSYSWDFTEDGLADARGEQANYTFDRSGTYSIELNVTDDAGYSNSTTQNVTVSTATSTEQETPTATSTTTKTAPTTTAETEVTASADSSGGAQDGTGTTTAPNGSEEQSGAFGPGFGLIGAVVAILSAVVLRAQRKT